QPDGRNSDGTFAKGNPGGPGRPPRATESTYIGVVMTACNLDTWREIVERAVDDARNGDAKARDWLTSYLVGKPAPSADAPRPSMVLAEYELGIDPVEEVVRRLQRNAKLSELFDF